MRKVFMQRTKVTPLEDRGVGVGRSSQEEQRNHLESLSTAQPSTRVFGNKTGISTATFKSKSNTEPPFPRAVRANKRLSLSIT